MAGEKVSTDNSLPAEYPKDDLPPPSPSTVIYSAVGQFGISVFFTSSLPDEEVKRRFLDTLRSKRWTLHTCQGAGDTTLMVASRPGYVVSIAIGFNPANAERIGGKRYSFFLSIATKGDRPKPTATPC